MWFITLLVLAVAAVLVIKAVKAHSERQSSAALEQRSSDVTADGNQASASADMAASANETEASATHGSQSATATAQGDDGPAEDTLLDIREMIKTLNLTESDAPRLGISEEQFSSLRQSANEAHSSTLPDTDTCQDVADRLRRMLS